MQIPKKKEKKKIKMGNKETKWPWKVKINKNWKQDNTGKHRGR